MIFIFFIYAWPGLIFMKNNTWFNPDVKQVIGVVITRRCSSSNLPTNFNPITFSYRAGLSSVMSLPGVHWQSLESSRMHDFILCEPQRLYELNSMEYSTWIYKDDNQLRGTPAHESNYLDLLQLKSENTVQASPRRACTIEAAGEEQMGQSSYCVVSFLKPIVGNCLVYPSTSWRSFATLDWMLELDCRVATKSFNFVPRSRKALVYSAVAVHMLDP